MLLGYMVEKWSNKSQTSSCIEYGRGWWVVCVWVGGSVFIMTKRAEQQQICQNPNEEYRNTEQKGPTRTTVNEHTSTQKGALLHQPVFYAFTHLLTHALLSKQCLNSG